MATDDFENSLAPGSKIRGVFLILKDQQWHCRECEYRHLNIMQIAGGSGIQGLQRGNKSRDGLEIESGNHFCKNCNRQTRHDRWTGRYAPSIKSSGMTGAFVRRAIQLLGGRDVVERTKRPDNELAVDHKLPQLRWDAKTSMRQTDYVRMTDGDIKRRFQLLKKSNGSVSHNLLKSRSCERCYRTGKRGTPFGINFHYEGDEKWRGESRQDAKGCIGCGWYDFDRWRRELNRTFKERNVKRTNREK